MLGPNCPGKQLSRAQLKSQANRDPTSLEGKYFETAIMEEGSAFGGRSQDLCAMRSFTEAFTHLKSSRNVAPRTISGVLTRVPRTPAARRLASLQDRPIDLGHLAQLLDSPEQLKTTILYLAYASNLSAETFLEKRQIKPLSQINVVVPELAVSFNLPGIAYSEPCFGNVRYRRDDVRQSLKFAEERSFLDGPPEYHKDRWKKGLVGVVYEVTQRDFAHIIATEGGGASYQDVLVDCYTLSENPDEEVPADPTSVSFKAHTLFSPGLAVRPHPSYAQPSARYLKLITDGAREHSLPYEYQNFLSDIRPYQITTVKQQLGRFIFLSFWTPIIVFLFTSGKMFVDEHGMFPLWLAKLSAAIFAACWTSYDIFFKPMFGDGERTIYKEEGPQKATTAGDEKDRLLDQHGSHYGT